MSKKKIDPLNSIVNNIEMLNKKKATFGDNKKKSPPKAATKKNSPG